MTITNKKRDIICLVFLAISMILIINTLQNEPNNNLYEGSMKRESIDSDLLKSNVLNFKYTTLAAFPAFPDYIAHSFAISGDIVTYPVYSNYFKLFALDIGRGEIHELIGSSYIPHYGNVAYQHYAIIAKRGSAGVASEPSEILKINYNNNEVSTLIPAHDYDKYKDLSLSFPYLVFVHEYYSGPSWGTFYRISLDIYNLLTGESLIIEQFEVSDFFEHEIIKKPALDGNYVVWIRGLERSCVNTELWTCNIETGISSKLLVTPTYENLVYTAVNGEGITVFSKLVNDNLKTELWGMNIESHALWLISNSPTFQGEIQMD